MPDLLSSRFIARVEQSLRKRINTDVRNHLIRVATHTQSEHEFVAGAARLLLNQTERERWLALWEERIRLRMQARHGSHRASHHHTSGLDETVMPSDHAGLDEPIERSFEALAEA
jgi:hypothetical protein